VTLALRMEEAEAEPRAREALLTGDALEPALLLPEAEEVSALAEPEAELLGGVKEAEAEADIKAEAAGSRENAAEALELALPSESVEGAGLLDKELLEQALAVRQSERVGVPEKLPEAALAVLRPLPVLLLMLEAELLPDKAAEELPLKLEVHVEDNEAQPLEEELPVVVAAAAKEGVAHVVTLPVPRPEALKLSEEEALTELLELTLNVASTVVGPAL
jgi:hypothetical protein